MKLSAQDLMMLLESNIVRRTAMIRLLQEDVALLEKQLLEMRKAPDGAGEVIK